MPLFFLFMVAAWFFWLSPLDAQEPKLELTTGDRIGIVGNTLAERMQHDGWLEAYLYSRFPKHELVVRNLGFSGDELTLRLRSANFGSPDDWLRRVRADVIFAFFGYNESFAGAAGLDKFKKDLADFIQHTQAQKYNGKSPPRLVLFSPIAFENLGDRNLPDGSEHNQRLKQYTAALADVAGQHKIPFVDLYQATRDLYAREARPLTINGIHLNERGNRLLAGEIDKALFASPFRHDRQALERIRRAVVEKNFYWFNRYRTVDGYSIYGGRADLRFVNGQTNREVMQREMEVLDVMTANRDRRIWAAAQGQDLAVDDTNTPPFIPVLTNKPGPLPGGKHVFLGGEEAIAKMTVAKGMKVNLFASEKEFPELVNPVQMAWDPQGRLWVAVWPTYPHWKPKEPMNDKLLILEDTNADGRADKLTVFADDLHCPTGFEFYNGGVLVAQVPDLVYLKDTNGDGKADFRQRVLHGLDSADTHHAANSFVFDPGGALYFQEGTFHHTQVETPYGPPVRLANAGVFRYEPRTHKFEVYVTFPFANPHGHVFDRWGQDIVVDGTGSQPYHAALFSGRLEFPHKHKQPPQVYQQRTRPCPGMEILSSRHFPPELQGNLLVGNVIGFQGILQYKLTDQGASFAGTEVEPIVSSTDPNFRPADLKIGPDGALYFIDWHNPIIGHMQHNLRDPSRDREHGRVYRVTVEGRPLTQSPPIAGQPLDKLLDLLKEPEDRVRYRTRIELGGRDTDQVITAARKWLARLDKNDPEHEHHLLEALWLHQSHNVVDAELLKRVLTSPDFRARAAATRVLCYWRDRVPDALETFKKLAADPHPRVRLEAVRAASFFPTAEALEVVLVAGEHPTDKYLDFVRGETLRTLDPYVKRAIASGKPIPFTTPAGSRYFVKTVSTDDLLKLPRSRGVYHELLTRKGVREEHRREALSGLAKLDNSNELRVLLETIRAVAAGPQPGAAEATNRRTTDESVLYDLFRLLTAWPAAELSGIRDQLEQLAVKAELPTVRQLGFVALVAADGSADRAWSLALSSPTTLQDLVTAIPLLRDSAQRAALYPRVELLLDGLPKELSNRVPPGKPVRGRYVLVAMPGRQRTLTLAEVEVYSDGRNVAPQGQARQSSEAPGFSARLAIDGNPSGQAADGSLTQTQVGTADPWWEVDLQAEFPIEQLILYGRTDGDHDYRLNHFTVQVLDRDRKVVFERTGQSAPEAKVIYSLLSEAPQQAIRWAAMLALTSVRGQEEQAFKSLARFVGNDGDRNAAVQALRRIPIKHWPKDLARPLVDQLLSYVRTVPDRDRNAPAVVEAMQLAEDLASLLPREQARQARQQLGALGVRVLRLATLPDQMLYDQDRLAVQAGKPVEIVFENTDLMPHNFVLVEPGALEEIGLLAEATAAEPRAPERQYVPGSKRILLASRLVQPREAQKLSFLAPTKPGVYPYVCTYPGHWRRMYGALYVVADLNEYLLDPEEYLAKNPLPVADAMLKFIRPRKEWKFDELAGAVEELHGRSFSNGKQLFRIASCVACHKLNGEGVEIGPDLSKPDPKLKPLDLLREIVEPSHRINEQYQTYAFELHSGKVITGLIVSETPDEIKVIENPLAKAEPVVLQKTDIAERIKSPNSIMPKGLLDKLTREEILDLVAYVLARGDAQHHYFQGHDHKH